MNGVIGRFKKNALEEIRVSLTAFNGHDPEDFNKSEG
jgi:hypothetical protein